MVSDLKKYFIEEDAKKIEIYLNILQKSPFWKFIKGIFVCGSKVKKDKKAFDIDISIIVDDGDVKRMGTEELQEKLFQRFNYMAAPLSGLHIQGFPLTRFMKGVLDSEVVLDTQLRTPLVLHDPDNIIGSSQYVKNKGIVRATKATIDNYMNAAEGYVELADRHSKDIKEMLEKAVDNADMALLLKKKYRVTAIKIEPEKMKDVANLIVKKPKGLEKLANGEINKKQIPFVMKSAGSYVNKVKKYVNKGAD